VGISLKIMKLPTLSDRVNMLCGSAKMYIHTGSDTKQKFKGKKDVSMEEKFSLFL